MPAVAEPVSESLFFSRQALQLDLLRQAAAKLARQRLSDEEAKPVLEQMVRIGLDAPRMMRDLWTWALQQDEAGRIQNRPIAGQVVRERFCGWLDLLDLIHQTTCTSEQHGFPIPGAEDLRRAADELGAMAQEVNQAWPIEELPEPDSSTGVPYPDLRRFADQPVANEWPDDDFNPF